MYWSLPCHVFYITSNMLSPCPGCYFYILTLRWLLLLSFQTVAFYVQTYVNPKLSAEKSTVLSWLTSIDVINAPLVFDWKHITQTKHSSNNCLATHLTRYPLMMTFDASAPILFENCSHLYLCPWWCCLMTHMAYDHYQFNTCIACLDKVHRMA